MWTALWVSPKILQSSGTSEGKFTSTMLLAAVNETLTAENHSLSERNN